MRKETKDLTNINEARVGRQVMPISRTYNTPCPTTTSYDLNIRALLSAYYLGTGGFDVDSFAKFFWSSWKGSYRLYEHSVWSFTLASALLHGKMSELFRLATWWTPSPGSQKLKYSRRQLPLWPEIVH